MDFEITNFCCPLCDTQLVKTKGAPKMPDFGGVTLTCPSFNCPAQEVFGHGRSEKSAYAVILSKYTGNRQAGKDLEETEETEELPTVEREEKEMVI